MIRSDEFRVANVVEEGKVGGPQVRMVRVAAMLSGRVDTLIVMPEENSDAFRALCEQKHVPFRVLPLTRITKEYRAALAYILFSPAEVLRLARLFRKERVTLVHVSGGSWQFKGVLAARLAGVPAVWHLNDTYIPGLIRRLFRFFARFAYGFIFASHRSREYYESVLHLSKPDDVVPAPVDPEQFNPAVEIPGDENLIASWDDELVIGTVSNVNRFKGLETLIRAAAALKGRTVRVVVVGPIFENQKKYHRKLLDLAAELGVDKLDFVGARTDVRPLLKRFDIYVCSSQVESSPVSVWEAMAMGRSVVSTDVGDVPRHVRDGESGYIVPVGDHVKMAERLVTLVDDTNLRADLGRNARRIAAENFAPQRVADLTLDMYRRVKEYAERECPGCGAPERTRIRS